MKKMFIALMCMAAVVLMSSCGKSKTEIVLDEFENLIEEVEKKKGDLTVEEWTKMQDDFNKRFEELGIDKIDENEFSAMEKLKMVGLTVRWGAAMVKSTPKLLESTMEQAEKEAAEKAATQTEE